MNEYMKIAIEEAEKGMSNSEGGPFGCVVVKDGAIVGRGHNQVVARFDSTCHGEMQAIRDACKNLKSFDLSGCEIYTTGEPCNMCLAACIWARIGKVYYGCTIGDNEDIGFRDKAIDAMFGGREKFAGYIECIDRSECLSLFDKYKQLKNATKY